MTIVCMLFLQRSHPNEMLTGLRYFERVSKGDNGANPKVSTLGGADVCMSNHGCILVSDTFAPTSFQAILGYMILK